MLFQTFPTYLLPSLPFTIASRRRKKSSSSSRSAYSETSVPSLSTSPSTSASADGSPSLSTSPPAPTRAISHKFTGMLHAALQKHQNPPAPEPQRLSRVQPNTLKCVTCATDVAFASQIVSKGFTGRHGRAYLVSPPARSPDGSKGRKSTKLVNVKIGRPVNRELLTGAHVVADVSCLICSSILGWKYLDAKEQGQKYKIGKYILETKRVVEVVSWEDGVEGLEETELVGGDMDRDDDGVVIFDDEDEDECDDLFTGTWNASEVAGRRAMRVYPRTTDASN